MQYGVEGDRGHRQMRTRRLRFGRQGYSRSLSKSDERNKPLAKLPRRKCRQDVAIVPAVAHFSRRLADAGGMISDATVVSSKIEWGLRGGSSRSRGRCNPKKLDIPASAATAGLAAPWILGSPPRHKCRLSFSGTSAVSRREGAHRN